MPTLSSMVTITTTKRFAPEDRISGRFRVPSQELRSIAGEAVGSRKRRTNGRPRVLMPGGYGVLGRHLARELLGSTEAHLVIAGRDGAKAARTCDQLGSPDRVEPLGLDLCDLDAVEDAAIRCVAVACTAGPFQDLPPALPRVAVRAGAHWLDVSDQPSWVVGILDDQELVAARVTVIPGLSAVPAVSGLLARWCLDRLPAARAGRVTLFIGNRNEKGAGATASALMGGFNDPAWVRLPFGLRRAYRFATPDRELFWRDLGVEAEFRVALEWAYLGWLTARLSRITGRLGVGGQTRLARLLSRASRPFSRLGTEMGCVQVDLWTPGGRVVSAVVVAGQAIVVLPCALAVGAILEGAVPPGVAHPATWLPVDAYVEGLRSRGVRFLTRRWEEAF
jgi:hypothetical protein